VRIASSGAAAAGGSGSVTAASAARRPNTKHSASEFEASRLAPCSPVQADSPIAYRPGSDERPSMSVAIPPIV
jgi:hypothetical protein